MVVPVVDQPEVDVLRELGDFPAGAEVVDEEDPGLRVLLELGLGVDAVTRAELGVQVGGGDDGPAGDDAGGGEFTDGAVGLVGLADSGGSEEQQRRAAIDAGDGRAAPLLLGLGVGDEAADPGVELGPLGDGGPVVERDKLGDLVDAPAGDVACAVGVAVVGVELVEGAALPGEEGLELGVLLRVERRCPLHDLQLLVIGGLVFGVAPRLVAGGT